MFSYGTATYGSYAFDQANLQTVSSGSVSSTSTATRIQSALASGSAASSNTSDSTRVRESDGSISASASASANGVFIAYASGSTSASASVLISYIRKRNSGALVSLESSTAAIGREKWEPIAANSVTWTQIAA